MALPIFLMLQTVVDPMTPPEVRSFAIKICGATSELVDRIIRTFEQFKDPETFVADPTEEIEAAEQKIQMQQEMQLAMMLQGGGMAGGGVPPEAGGAPQPADGEPAPPQPAMAPQ